MNMVQPIKIVRIFSRLNIGGPAVHTILLTARLNHGRFKTCLVKGSESPHEGDMLYFAEEKRINPVVIPEMGRNLSFWGDIRALWKIFRLVLKEKPRIIHTHTAKAGVLGRVAGTCYKIACKLSNNILCKGGNCHSVVLVHTFHGHVFHGYFHPIKTKIFLCIEKILACLTDKIITVSEQQRKEILGFGIGTPKKVIAIPLGLELDRFLAVDRFKGALRKELGISRETKLVGIIARLVPIKNHSLFIDAAAELKKTQAWHLKFLVVGDGELRKSLEEYARQRGFLDDMLFLGFRKDLERIYADLDIIALTSLNEGSPVALIEAMAAGRPVIATDVGGVRDLFSAERSGVSWDPALDLFDEGLLIPPKDSHAFARGLAFLLKHDELRMKMGRKGRQKVWPHFDISRLVDDMGLLYETLIEKKA